jgi:hypothetical protein
MRALLSAIVLTAFAAGPAAAQADSHAFGRGTEYFRFILSQNGAKPLTELESLRDHPGTKALIVFGRTGILKTLCEDGFLEDFLKENGRLLVATDWPTPDLFNSKIGVQVIGEPWSMPPGYRDYIYRGTLTDCPRVIKYEQTNANLVKTQLFDGLTATRRPAVTNIVTNRPSQIGMIDQYWPVATLFRPGEARGFVGNIPPPLRNRVLFGVVGMPWGWWKNVLVFADHSMFINDMMAQTDNDNAAFANNVVHWLLAPDGEERRTDVLFYEDEKIQTEFNASLTYPAPIPVPPLETLVPLVDEAVVALERDNVFNKLLIEASGDWRTVVRTILFLLTLVLLAYGVYRFLQARYRPDVRVPRLPIVLKPAGAGGLTAVEQRHRAVMSQGNLAEAARELAHQAFAGLGLPPTPGTPPPAVTVAGSWWERVRGRRLTRDVRDLWTLATRGPSRRVSPAALEKLDATLRGLTAAVTAGKVRLAGIRGQESGVRSQ